MSVMTSSQEDVSAEIRQVHRHAHDIRGDTIAPSSKKQRAHASTVSLLATQRTLTLAPPMVLAVVLLVGWYVGANIAHVSTLFLPAPADVVTSLSNGLSNGLFLSNAWVTVQESLLGFLLALVIA